MSDNQLYAIVLRLAAIRRGAVPADHGDQARAALMQIVKRGDSPFAQTLHDTNDHKPYTISLLRGGTRGADRALHFGDGDSADWRFTLLCDPAFEALLRRYLLNRDLPHVRIGAVEFAVVDAFASGLNHPDSGHISIAELHQRWNCAPETLARHVTLEFRSSTTFSLGTDPETKRRRFQAYPDARLLFSALRKRWARLGGLAPGDEFDEWVGRAILTEPLRLDVRPTMVEGQRLASFIGRTRYSILGGDVRWLPFIHLLADLAFWTGVGYQVTRGMGQARRVQEDEDGS